MKLFPVGLALTGMEKVKKNWVAANFEAVGQSFGLAIATTLFFVAQAYKPALAAGALVTFVAYVCALFIAISVSNKNRLIEQRDEFQRVLKEVTRLSNHDEVSGLPADNLCIFDDNELTMTFGNPNQESSTTIWLNEKRIAGFFVKHFDLIKTQYATEYSKRIDGNSASAAGSG